MYSNSPFKNYFLIVISLIAVVFLWFIGYFRIQERIEQAYLLQVIFISALSFTLNVFIIFNINSQKKRKIIPLAIYIVLFGAFFKEFYSINMGVVYLLCTLVLLLVLDVLSISSSFKYFNIGALITISSLLYFPIIVMVPLFFFITLLYYKKKINISQYIAGVFVASILILEVTFLTGNFSYIEHWIQNLHVPKFHIEYQIPIIIIIFIITIYGWIYQYTNQTINNSIEQSSKYTILVFYLFAWILIYALFMGDNYHLLIFVSLPVSLILPKSI
ncbi:hypothetical protein ETU08_05745 [Apibacter muscae]|uniref:DUF6427 family protein n=1 Tax=Apibacter muscae TaxID=2509004 RepID=UPI0011ABF44A|nr:DUF6427 family protein [Apibacter muscae]TWP30061.1 hypothetical protein ETU08_05745 [Apibacter muscae]